VNLYHLCVKSLSLLHLWSWLNMHIEKRSNVVVSPHIPTKEISILTLQMIEEDRYLELNN
jgi:hypothetical protein